MDIKFTKTAAPKDPPKDENSLGFGRIFTDHMFIMDYGDGEWRDPRIVPYGDISLSPASMVLHYAQEIFEGLKAYRVQSGENRGKIQLFRPDENFARMNESAQRLVIPRIDEAFALQALKELLRIEEKFVPHGDGASLYVRPFIFATDPFVGVRPAQTYKFMIILSPSGAYYSTGLAPVPIMVEEKYVRAVKGGVGQAKTGGNYASSLAGQQEAHHKGYEQVLWLDGASHKYVEEVGSMNIFFVVDGEVGTPQLNGSILSGITRKSVLELVRKWGYNVSERRVSIDEITRAADEGRLSEAFGTGTAAVISAVGKLRYNEKDYNISDDVGSLTRRLYDTLTGIQYGKIPDDMCWTTII